MSGLSAQCGEGSNKRAQREAFHGSPSFSMSSSGTDRNRSRRWVHHANERGRTMTAASIARPGWRLRIPSIETRQLGAGLSATMFYVFGPVPLYFASARAMGGNEIATAGFIAVFLSAGIATAAL